MKNCPLIGTCALDSRLLERQEGSIRPLRQYRGDVVLLHPPENYDLSQIAQRHFAAFVGHTELFGPPDSQKSFYFASVQWPSKSRMMWKWMRRAANHISGDPGFWQISIHSVCPP